MDITQLTQLFESYATKNKALAHNAADKNNIAFLECDMEEVQSALRTGLKFPCMLVQTPEVDKEGSLDNIVEQWEGSFIILMPQTTDLTKSQCYQRAKNICDQIITAMVRDTFEYFEGGMMKTSEGKIGPVSDRLYGWGVNFGFDQGFDASFNPDNWNE